jgi:shikimate 5-dehydrogenase
MYFIGVTTGSSSILKLFPIWAEILGIDAQLLGYDLPLDAPKESYREIVQHIKTDPLARGALVTTHKINLLNAVRDLFDYLDPNALLCNEISSISKRGAKLEGHAIDPISSRLTWESFVPANSAISSVLCLGAGGAATAISVAMAQLEQPPKRFFCVDRDAARLEALRNTHAQLQTSMRFEYYQTSSANENDALLTELETGSVVINATGMGKDRPGSPITDAAIFPQHGIVWELNYRGSLEFWQQAKTQKQKQSLTLKDGWLYFLHGWTQVIAQVFDLQLTPEMFKKLEAAASGLRPT